MSSDDIKYIRIQCAFCERKKCTSPLVVTCVACNVFRMYMSNTRHYVGSEKCISINSVRLYFHKIPLNSHVFSLSTVPTYRYDNFINQYLILMCTMN